MGSDLEARYHLHLLNYVIRAILTRLLSHLVQHSPQDLTFLCPQLQLTSWKVCMVTMISLVSAEQSSFSLATKRRGHSR